MTEHKLTLWVKGFATQISVMAETDKELTDALETILISRGEQPIVRIAGVDGFQPLSNRDHFLAAGYGIGGRDAEILAQPAHFNPPCFVRD